MKFADLAAGLFEFMMKIRDELQRGLLVNMFFFAQELLLTVYQSIISIDLLSS